MYPKDYRAVRDVLSSKSSTDSFFLSALNVGLRRTILDEWEWHHPFLPLTDRGLRQAISLGQIRAEKTITDSVIQPATLEYTMHDVDDQTPPDRLHWFPTPAEDGTSGLRIRPQADVSFVCGERYEFSRNLFPHLMLRSSLGRVGLGLRFHIPRNYWLGSALPRTEMEVMNFSPNAIYITQGKRVAQLLVGVNWSPIIDGDEAHFDKQLADYASVLQQVETGIEIRCEKVLRGLHDRGNFSVSPSLEICDSLVVFRASSHAYRFRNIGNFNIDDTLALKDALEEVDISDGYLLRPHEHLLVRAGHTVDLSSTIGIKFLERPVLELLDIDPVRAMHAMSHPVVNSAWFDPGYHGGYYGHIKVNPTMKLFSITEGDVIGFGRVFYFPKGVEVPYGEKNVVNYQGATEPLVYGRNG